jgi:hypothetical protein
LSSCRHASDNLALIARVNCTRSIPGFSLVLGRLNVTCAHTYAHLTRQVSKRQTALQLPSQTLLFLFSIIVSQCFAVIVERAGIRPLLSPARIACTTLPVKHSYDCANDETGRNICSRKCRTDIRLLLECGFHTFRPVTRRFLHLRDHHMKSKEIQDALLMPDHVTPHTSSLRADPSLRS